MEYLNDIDRKYIEFDLAVLDFTHPDDIVGNGKLQKKSSDGKSGYTFRMAARDDEILGLNYYLFANKSNRNTWKLTSINAVMHSPQKRAFGLSVDFEKSYHLERGPLPSVEQIQSQVQDLILIKAAGKVLQDNPDLHKDFTRLGYLTKNNDLILTNADAPCFSFILSEAVTTKNSKVSGSVLFFLSAGPTSLQNEPLVKTVMVSFFQDQKEIQNKRWPVASQDFDIRMGPIPSKQEVLDLFDTEKLYINAPNRQEYLAWKAASIGSSSQPIGKTESLFRAKAVVDRLTAVHKTHSMKRHT